MSCILCGAAELETVAAPRFMTVTSDCKPWLGGSPIAVCVSCGHVQRILTKEWKDEVRRIYAAYDLYHLSSGQEQVVFTGSQPAARSSRLISCLESAIDLPEHGRLLDVGCGNGALLRSFSSKRPAWLLVGHDSNEAHRNQVVQIPGVKNFFSSIEQVQGEFELITLLHVLEHVFDPVRFLDGLRQRLSAGGKILIEVPYFIESPFDLVVADHCSFFMPSTLQALVKKAGIEILRLETGWIVKEISCVCASEHGSTAVPREQDPGRIASVEMSLLWLQATADHARQWAEKVTLGILGTAIAGTWLATILDDRFHFFVDEDYSRMSRSHLGKPIYHPSSLAPGSFVYIALPVSQAHGVCGRLNQEYPDVTFILPPESIQRSVP